MCRLLVAEGVGLEVYFKHDSLISTADYNTKSAQACTAGYGKKKRNFNFETLLFTPVLGQNWIVTDPKAAGYQYRMGGAKLKYFLIWIQSRSGIFKFLSIRIMSDQIQVNSKFHSCEISYVMD